MKTNKSVRADPMPPFKTLDEEAEFWDTHDTSALFDNPKIALSKLPLLEKEKEDVINVRIQKSLKNKLQNFARSKGIGPTTLARMWIIEKLNAISS